MKILQQLIGSVSVIGLLSITACKKEVDQSSLNPTTPPTTTPAKDPIKDTAIEYTKEVYLWYNQIPSTFNAQGYADLDQMMTAVRQYSTETGFTQPVDRWSFAIQKSTWDNVSSGISGDFGIDVFFKQEGDLRVKAVQQTSPAGKSGIKRGWRITKINGSSNINTSNADFIINAVWNSASTSFTFLKPDNTSVDVTLNAATYQEQPVLLDTVYSRDGHNIGYFVFNSFLGDTSSIYRDFDRIINNFKAQNVSDVVVDLRYNGGGYVNVQERLANYLAPVAANGGVMMKQEFNKNMAQYNETSTYSKIGSLNLNRIFFIVSNSTASASELLINNLKPYMEVILVGPSKTYGKPVGYFPIPVGSWYIFPVSFRTTNKNGEGAYFNGLPLNYTVSDGLDKDWGDLSEPSLQSAVNYAVTGMFKSQMAGGKTSTYQESPQVTNGNYTLDKHSFKGAVDTRKLR